MSSDEGFISHDNRILWGLDSLIFKNLEASRRSSISELFNTAAEKEVRSVLMGLQILLNYNFSTRRNHGFNISLLTDPLLW